MEFGILGPLVISDGVQTRTVPSGRQRALLAALLIRHGQPTSAQFLTEAIWDEHPPRSAAAALRNYVMRLRKALGAAGERIETTAGGYRIDVDAQEFDLQRFTVLRDEGIAALRRQDFEGAATRLDTALQLWRGPALADIPSDALLRKEAGWLAEARLDAVEARLEAQLRLGGDVRALTAELQALTTEYPERELLWAQLMTVLYRSGRQSEALAVYQRVRQTLIEEIGVEPGSELREVHQRVLRGDPALDGPARPRPEPIGISSASAGAAADPGADEGSGAGAAGHPVPDRTAGGRPAFAVTPCQLPAALPDFTGRAGETSLLTGRLTAVDRTAPFTAVISGQPGVGKSALAGQVAHATRAAFPDGTLHAELGGTGDSQALPATVLRTFLIALGVPADLVPVGLEDRISLYRSLLTGRRILVVLDDARDSAQVRPLLPGDPGCAALVTSRYRLADLAGALPLELDVLSAAEAELLLRRLVGTARSAADPQAATQVVAACGRLPLALRICAARLGARPGWSMRHLADRLADQLMLLNELRVCSLDIRASVEPSYRALEPAAARAFRLLATATDGPLSTVQAARALHLPLPAAEHLLERLVDAHLLLTDAPGRYRYPALLRAFAREQGGLRPGAVPAQQDRRAAAERLAAPPTPGVRWATEV
ncbi:BTAD domain-containing putative transcriptional regulator [Kitasatospora sp. NPDC101801]|uniref:AfsR/SARP family transcriptional regulator n=1 Tax=Kitasatospora sp. NPDC101801 TaxID=3364103 RepID=UPI003810F858